VADHFDVIIVGTGAGGGTLAHTLAPTGKRILLLERGTYLPREMDDWNPKPVFVDGKYISADTWYDGDGTPFQPQVHYFVGGATKMYGAALYRLRPEDFGEIQHVDGVSPAWPVSYADFEPWYTRAEWLYQVHGAHGEDPTEGPSSRQYPWPAVSHEPRIQQISDTLVQAGYDPFHAPCGILLDEADRPASTCIRCATCDGYPCLVHAKSDAEIIAVRPVLGLPNVTLMVNSEVVRLETDPSGRTVAGVVVDHGGDGKEDVYTGDIVVLAAGAANTARILLRSASDTHPAGLANGSDQVGRNYMFHNSKAIAGFGAEPNDTVFQKTLGLNDFYLAGDGRQWPLGNVQMLGKSNEGAMKGEEPHLTKLVPGWSLEEAARHAVDFWLTTEDLPRPGNRVTIDRDGAIHLSYADSNQAEAAGLYEEFRKVLNHIGLARHHVLHKNFYMSMNIPLAGCAHQAGTCRFGADPATSVVDLNCKAHELDNLYVADTSIFPSIGAVNPALTAIANGIRVGEHIAERLGASTGTAWAPAQRTKPAQGTQSAQGTQPTSHPASAIGGGDLPADHSAGPRRSDRNSPSSSTARRCPRSEPASRSTISPVRTACISVAYARTSSFISVPSGSALRISSSTIRRTGIR
jgi:choline dehydrogenase-like flavoprotein